MTDNRETHSTTDSRRCTDCGQHYSIQGLRSNAGLYFEAPYNYDRGCDEYCVACWLEAGPADAHRIDAMSI